MYLAESFAASAFYHRLAGDSKVELTEYRKNLVRNPKVQKVWHSLLRGKFAAPGPFSEAVDHFIQELPDQGMSASHKTD